MARTRNRHPRILEQLGELLPPGGRRPDTRLLEDLRLGKGGVLGLVRAVEEAWQLPIDSRAAAEWRTLADVADTIADAVAVA